MSFCCVCPSIQDESVSDTVLLLHVSETKMYLKYSNAFNTGTQVKDLTSNFTRIHLDYANGLLIGITNFNFKKWPLKLLAFICRNKLHLQPSTPITSNPLNLWPFDLHIRTSWPLYSTSPTFNNLQSQLHPAFSNSP